MMKFEDNNSNLFSLVTKVAKLGLWTWNFKTGVQEWNGVIHELLEIESSNSQPEKFYEHLKSRCAPQQFDYIRSKFSSAVEDGNPFKLDIKVNLPSGRGLYQQSSSGACRNLSKN